MTPGQTPETSQSPNIANRIGLLLGEVYGIRERDPLGLGALVERNRRDEEAEDLEDRGFSPQEAADAVALLHADEDNDRAMDIGLLRETYADVLQDGGLELVDTAYGLRLTIMNGEELSQALVSEQLPVDAAERERLASGLTRLLREAVGRTLHWAQSTNEREIRDLLGSDEVPGELPVGWIEAGDDYQGSLEDVHQAGQLEEHGEVLAQRLREAGGEESVARELQVMAEFMQEGNMVPFAIASYLGLVPETRPEEREGSTYMQHWQFWNDIAAWQPAVNLLHNVPSGSRFHTHLRRSIEEIITGEEAYAQTILGQSVDEFVRINREADEAAWQRLQKEAELRRQQHPEQDYDDDPINYRQSEAELRERYPESRAEADQLLEMYAAIRAQLARA